MPFFDKLEKTTLGIVLSIVLLFVFSVIYAQNKYSNNTSQSMAFNTTFNTASIDTLNPTNYRVFAVANNEQLQPSQVQVPAGSKVDFYVTSNDVSHEFNIAGKNVQLTATHGTINKASVTFDKPGVYKIICSDSNNSAMPNVQAEIIVQQPQ